jgi:hypothetical protein
MFSYDGIPIKVHLSAGDNPAPNLPVPYPAGKNLKKIFQREKKLSDSKPIIGYLSDNRMYI